MSLVMSQRSFKTNHHRYTQPEIEYDSEEFAYYPDIDSDFDEDVDDDFTDDQVAEEASMKN